MMEMKGDRMSRQRLIFSLVVVAMLLIASPVLAATFNLATDWSSTANPNGQWSYGWVDATSGAFSPYNVHPYQQYWYPGQSYWCVGQDLYGYGNANKNLATGTVVFYNGGSARRTTARWASNATASVYIWATFTASSNGTYYNPIRCAVRRNGIEQFATTSSYNNTLRIAGSISVNAGDSLDICTGAVPGATGQTQNYVTLSAIISTDQPGTVSGTVYSNLTGHPTVGHAVIKTSDGKYSTTSDASGAYTLALPPGSYALVASENRFASDQSEQISISQGANTPLDFDLIAGSLTGTVTSDTAGNPPIAGAIVRTDGSPSYSANTGADGAYTLFAPQIASTTRLLVAAPGHDPQRDALALSAGQTKSKSFALRPTGAGMLINLPAPGEWGEPGMAPTAPGDAFAVKFSNPTALPSPGAPAISGWNETIKPDETFTMTGVRFTARTGVDTGTDTVVWLYADTPSGGVLRQIKVWRVTASSLTALMPSDIPFGMYLVWIENEDGVSAPVTVNRTTSQWIGPLGASGAAGATKRVFGRNVSSNHGTTSSYVYIQPAEGGAFTQCAVTQVEPYAVWFTIPSGTANGYYKVYLHNGHGGRYGWSDPVDLSVAPDWTRDPAQVAVTPNGTNDSINIQNAIDSLSLNSNGGTVVLSAGDYILKGGLDLKNGVEIKGAGMNSTRLLAQLTSAVAVVKITGVNTALTDLTIRSKSGFTNPQGEITNVAGSSDAKFLRIRIESDAGIYSGSFSTPLRSEVVGCECNREPDPAGRAWIHNSTLYGDFHWATEAALNLMTNYNVVEYSHVETKNWPVSPTGSKNYTQFMTWEEFKDIVWSMRIALTYCSYNYIAHLTSKDVAVQTNKGEMILFHGHAAYWYGNVITCDGTRLTLRTDGLVDGQPSVINNYSDIHLAGGQMVPDGPGSWYALDGKYISILAGAGFGESRRIVSHTPTTITIDRPFRVNPDATSKAMVQTSFQGNIIYKNDLNAFPVGYDQTEGSASVAVDIDGNGWSNMFEGNVSHRTRSGCAILSVSGGPSYWNEARDHEAYDVESGGFQMIPRDDQAIGPDLVGNRYEGGIINVTGSAGGAIHADGGDGNACEGITATSKRGIFMTHGGYDWHPATPNGLTLYRNNTVTTVDAPTSPSSPQPVYVMNADSLQWLMNNKYTNSSQPYVLASGVGMYSTPVAMRKLVKITGYMGYPIDEVLLEVANVGLSGMTWTAAASAPWIVPTVLSGNPTGPESDMGRLQIAVNPIGLAAGRHWGYIDILAGAKIARVGVCLDLSSGAPPSTAPVASFTATPTVGTTPLAVSFDARSSVAPGGLITSYVWEFGDGSTGLGDVASHAYLAGSYTATLTVTDSNGISDTDRKVFTVYPAVSSISISGSPTPLTDVGTQVTFTASAVGGYGTKYKFLLKTGNGGWATMQDYSTAATASWTPTASGFYAIKCHARASDSTRVYDATSKELSYPVGILPASGMALWLKADAGTTLDASGKISDWADQTSGSTKKLTQTTPNYRPGIVQGALNGQPVVRFTSASTYLSTTASVLSGATPFTAFTVARVNSNPAYNYQHFWWCGTDSIYAGYAQWMTTSGRLRASWGSSGALISTSTAATLSSWYTIASRYAPGLHEMWLNSTPVNTSIKSDSNLAAGFTVGNSVSNCQGLYGDIAELLIFSRKLTETERQGVEQYLSVRWSNPVPVAVDRLKDVKALGDGVLVSISTSKTAITDSGVYSDGGVYVSEADRTCGLKITIADVVQASERLTVTGTTDTDVLTGEKVFRVTSFSKDVGEKVNPLGMANKTLAASGQLLRVWGRVKEKTASYITLDDGSGVPAKVQIDGLTTPITSLPGVGDYISVTGPAGVTAGGGTAIRVRSSVDIKVY